MLVSALRPANHKGSQQVENKLQSTSKLFIPQVIIPQLHKSLFFKPQLKFYPQFQNANLQKKTITHVFESIYNLQALNTGTCIEQGGLFYSASLHRNRC